MRISPRPLGVLSRSIHLETRTTKYATTSPDFSAGSNVEEMTYELRSLVKPEGKWVLSADLRGVERNFKFKNFKQTWAFMSAVASEADRKGMKHHPEWRNVYNTVHIRWTTHKPLGVSMKDITMARFCDLKAAEFQEVPVVEGENQCDCEKSTQH